MRAASGTPDAAAMALVTYVTVGSGIPCAASGGMAHRQFIDGDGVEWTVYDVIPRADERRSKDRRDQSHAAELPVDRRGDDRRAGIPARPVRITRGWLCFESAGERRRLQPIPEDWHHSDDAGLIELMQQASVAPRRTRLGQEAEANRS
jgi:hypothetical protein